jgi:hypothetical protein
VIDQLLKEILPDGRSLEYEIYDQFLSCSDMVMKVNFSQNEIHGWKVNNDFMHLNLHDFLYQLKQDESLLQRLIIE